LYVFDVDLLYFQGKNNSLGSGYSGNDKGEAGRAEDGKFFKFVSLAPVWSDLTDQ